MLLRSEIHKISENQLKGLRKKDIGLVRECFDDIRISQTHALIVSGVRRGGKSTLLYQLFTQKYNNAFYLNFEHPGLYNFEFNDFSRLDEIILETGEEVLFFDEIQIIEGWERFVRQKLDEGFKVAITGSNASLLSRELGTKLTGRHISKELFPFSFREFCNFNTLSGSEESTIKYLATGGFPEYVKNEDSDTLTQLFDDILVRDIAIRYGVRDLKNLKRMALFLISNIGKQITGNKLKNLFELGARSTVMDYLSHFELSYLIFLVQKFSYSIKKQVVNPRKVYAIDTGMVNVNTLSFTEDLGRKFENAVFLHLRRNFSEIYYFQEKGECDFVVFKNGIFQQAIQVCYQLTPDNLDRELKGLFEAMKFFNVKEGKIITLNQKDTFQKENMIAEVLPFYSVF